MCVCQSCVYHLLPCLFVNGTDRVLVLSGYLKTYLQYKLCLCPLLYVNLWIFCQYCRTQISHMHLIPLSICIISCSVLYKKYLFVSFFFAAKSTGGRVLQVFPESGQCMLWHACTSVWHWYWVSDLNNNNVMCALYCNNRVTPSFFFLSSVVHNGCWLLIVSDVLTWSNWLLTGYALLSVAAVVLCLCMWLCLSVLWQVTWPAYCLPISVNGQRRRFAKVRPGKNHGCWLLACPSVDWYLPHTRTGIVS